MGTGRIDQSALGRLVTALGADEVAAICELFVADARDLLAEIRSACVARDVERAARAAHRVKSASGFLGFDRIAELCGEIERLVGKGRFDEVRVSVDRAAGELDEAAVEVAGLLGAPPEL